MGKFREWFSDNLRYILLGLFIILALVAVFLGIKFVSTKVNTKNTNGNIQKVDETNTVDQDTEASKQSNVTATPAEELENKNALEKNAYPKVNTIIQKYYTALGNKDIEGIKSIVDKLDVTEEAKITKDQYLERYSAVEAYTKKGSEDGTYIVFACYNYKFKDIDVSVPGLSQLYVCTKEDGSLYISIQEQNAETQQYIAEAIDDPEVQELIQGVEEAYKEVQEQNEDLKNFISTLGIATSEASEAENGTTVTLKSACNVREQSSEEAEILTELEAGEQVTKTGSEGEWIQIEFEGQTGYVRSDLFQ